MVFGTFREREYRCCSCRIVSANSNAQGVMSIVSLQRKILQKLNVSAYACSLHYSNLMTITDKSLQVPIPSYLEFGGAIFTISGCCKLLHMPLRLVPTSVKRVNDTQVDKTSHSIYVLILLLPYSHRNMNTISHIPIPSSSIHSYNHFQPRNHLFQLHLLNTNINAHLPRLRQPDISRRRNWRTRM